MPISWMTLSVPVIAAACAIFFIWREDRARQRLIARTLRGTARIRKIHARLYSAVTGTTLTRLALDIRPAGGTPYPLWPVEWYILPTAPARVTEGLILDVRIDPDDPTIIYPAVDWARRR